MNMSGRSKKGLLTLKDVAPIFQVSERTIYTWIRGGDLSGIRLPGKYLFSQQDLSNFFQKRRPADRVEDVK
jgi:excisionase family DNA binding protein